MRTVDSRFFLTIVVYFKPVSLKLLLPFSPCQQRNLVTCRTQRMGQICPDNTRSVNQYFHIPFSPPIYFEAFLANDLSAWLASPNQAEFNSSYLICQEHETNLSTNYYAFTEKIADMLWA